MKITTKPGFVLTLLTGLLSIAALTPVIAQAFNLTPLAAFGVLAAIGIFTAAAPKPAGMAYSILGCGDLLVVQGKIEQLWADAHQNGDYTANAEVLAAIIQNQTAQIGDISGKQDKNKKISVTWLSDCDIEAQDCSTDCLPDGPTLTPECKEYEPTICKEIAFKVNEDSLRNSIFSTEEYIARAMLKRVKILDETLAAAAVAFLEDSEGVNVFTGSLGTVLGSGVVGDSWTKIAPANWTASLMGYFVHAGIVNKFTMPYLISGNNLYQAYWNAQAEYANADGKGGLNKFNTLKPYFDLFNFTGAFSNESTFLLNKSAVAFGAKWQYDESPADLGKEGKRYSIASKALPGVRYDVHYNTDCVEREIYHKFNIIARAGFYLNPVGCSSTNTGVLRFENAS